MDSESDISFTEMDFDVEENVASSPLRGGYVQWQSYQIQGLPRHDSQPAFRCESSLLRLILGILNYSI